MQIMLPCSLEVSNHNPTPSRRDLSPTGHDAPAAQLAITRADIAREPRVN